MLATFKRARRFLLIQTNTILISLELVVLEVLEVLVALVVFSAVLVVLVALAVLTVLTALTALVVSGALVALIVHIALIVEADIAAAAEVVATVNWNLFLMKHWHFIEESFTEALLY